jgi:arginine decarboxylase
MGHRFPILLRFPEILRQRLVQLTQAFDQARAREDYAGRYLPVYPVKVNQERAVVEALVGAAGCGIGLEAGSKPELVMALVLAPPSGTIVANGYKDRDYVRLALLATRLGHRVFLVLEKPSELGRILEESSDLGITPHLGIRVRLSSIAGGKWQNTGGAKSKFGFTIPELIETVARLEQSDRKGTFELLHFHMGSQIANLRDIQGALQEAGRIWGELRGRGIRLDTVDVGGGLAVDYDGTRSRGDCSMNYSVGQYAEVIVRTFKEAAQAVGCPEPDLLSESGRALSAHHALLVTDIVETEPPASEDPPVRSAHPDWALGELWSLHKQEASLAPEEAYQEAVFWLAEVHARFNRGQIGLDGRAEAERLFHLILRQLERRWEPFARAGVADLRAELEERLAGKMFCNLSIFQSMPDVWALDQVFPVVPLTGHDRPSVRRVRLYDLTCDSDGRIDQYVGAGCLMPSLPVPADCGQPPWLGFFLLGAYQEILGDMHNLFGATDSAVIETTESGFQVMTRHRGDSALDLLRHVHLEASEIERRVADKLALASCPEETARSLRTELAQILEGSTYLTGAPRP